MLRIKRSKIRLAVNREILVSDLRSALGGAVASDDASCTGPCSGGMCGTDSCGGSCGCTFYTFGCTTITIVPCA